MTHDNEISRCVKMALDSYFKDLDGEKPSAVYNMVIDCVERPMLETILHYSHGNKTQAAEVLGINRNTLCKKMKDHGIKG